MKRAAAGKGSIELSASTALTTMAAVETLLSLAANQPIIGPFVQVLQLTIQTCRQVLINEENARRFQMTLGDAASITEEALLLAEMEGSAVKMDTVKKFVADLTDLLNEAVRELEKYTKKGFLPKILSGKSPSDTFQEYDNLLNQKFNYLNSALQITQQNLLEQTYEKVLGLEQWCNENGGLQNILEDQSKLAELADKIGGLPCLFNLPLQ
jgi:hypothetical protein